MAKVRTKTSDESKRLSKEKMIKMVQKQDILTLLSPPVLKGEVVLEIDR